MRKIYVTPKVNVLEINTGTLLVASPPLKYTDKEANKDYEVLTKPKQDWEYNWE